MAIHGAIMRPNGAAPAMESRRSAAIGAYPISMSQGLTKRLLRSIRGESANQPPPEHYVHALSPSNKPVEHAGSDVRSVIQNTQGLLIVE
jgi:hypothetical protein